MTTNSEWCGGEIFLTPPEWILWFETELERLAKETEEQPEDSPERGKLQSQRGKVRDRKTRVEFIERARERHDFVRLCEECYSPVFYVYDNAVEATSLGEAGINCVCCRKVLAHGEKARSIE